LFEREGGRAPVRGTGTRARWYWDCLCKATFFLGFGAWGRSAGWTLVTEEQSWGYDPRFLRLVRSFNRWIRQSFRSPHSTTAGSVQTLQPLQPCIRWGESLTASPEAAASTKRHSSRRRLGREQILPGNDFFSPLVSHFLFFIFFHLSHTYLLYCAFGD